jgi:hypothetical protein
VAAAIEFVPFVDFLAKVVVGNGAGKEVPNGVAGVAFLRSCLWGPVSFNNLQMQIGTSVDFTELEDMSG